jgi:hypothetical protein
MKKIIIIIAISLGLISCNQLSQTTSFDGTTYTVCTYTTGVSYIPKDAFHMETQTTNPNKVDSIKKLQLTIAQTFVKNY